ncbi:protein P21-like [Curcuma longa]|uniref:protein P21-like n=1 Tax=Curcuma longa TaxID=136217 RepID=UPI003D9EB1B7
MATSTGLVLCFFLFFFLLPLSLNAATFQIVNRCSFTVWAAWATTGPRAGGGNQLNPGQSWTININGGSTGGRIWARTGCSFDGSGRGRCQTGDCGGVLQCQGYGSPPNTLGEFSLNQWQNLDFFDISNIDGYNVGLDFSPTTGGCGGVRCAADIVGQCPAELRTAGGCNNACTVFRTDQYCCNSGNCGPTDYSRFFKARCPKAYSYPKDDTTSTFTCPGGSNYRATFCP